MSNMSIRAEGLGKRYRVGALQQPYYSLRDSVSKAATAPLRVAQKLGRRNANHVSSGDKRDFWALRDVHFEVKLGDVVGIIGRNGAGKSTLLKIVSEITEPTTGRVTIAGRVASLLEVGTGFHPELTGRENTFLNGAILGMRKAEIERKFSEIVAFAEVERFIDTQVKFYSSGMYLRLAFAVAAHLEPEILIVDEVLAVGDTAFQSKCLGKMADVSRSGRTVLFVSHNMAAVENLCSRGIVLEAGRIAFEGSQSDAIREYLSSIPESSGDLGKRGDHAGTGRIRIVAVKVLDTGGYQADILRSGMDVDFCMDYECDAGVSERNVIASLRINNQFGAPVFLQHNRLTADDLGVLTRSGTIVCRLRRLPLPASRYSVTYSLYGSGGFGEQFDGLENACTFSVVDGTFYQSGEVPPLSQGVALVDASWRQQNADRSNAKEGFARA